MKENESQWKSKCEALEKANSAIHLERAEALAQRDRNAATITALREENKSLRAQIEVGDKLRKEVREQADSMRAVLRRIGEAAGVKSSDAPSTLSAKFENAVVEAIARGRHPEGESRCACCHGTLMPLLCKTCAAGDQAKGQQVDDARKPAETLTQMHGIGFADSAEQSVDVIGVTCEECRQVKHVTSFQQAVDLGYRRTNTGRVVCRNCAPRFSPSVRDLNRDSYLGKLLDMRTRCVFATRDALRAKQQVIEEQAGHKATRERLAEAERQLERERAARAYGSGWIFFFRGRQVEVRVEGKLEPQQRSGIIDAIRKGFGNVIAPTKVETPGATIFPARFEHHLRPSHHEAGKFFEFALGFDAAKGKDETVFQIVNPDHSVREIKADEIETFAIKQNANGSIDIDLVFRTQQAPYPPFEVKLMNDIATYGRPKPERPLAANPVGAAKPAEAAEKIEYCQCSVEELRVEGIARCRGSKFVDCLTCNLPLHPKKEALMRKIIFRVR